MTGVGTCGVFITDRFRQAGRGANGKMSDRLGVGMLWKGGEVYRGMKNVKHTSDWFNLTNQRLPNTVSIRTASSDYSTLNSSQPKPAIWIVSLEKPSK
jgi:hypothetical protein